MFQPSVVQVPDLRNMHVPSARSKLHYLGLRARAVEPDGPRAFLPSLTVAAQEPPPGTAAKRRSVVTLYLVADGGVEYSPGTAR
jgi:beta-lactam-binding protein with PASTA domain